ncbi:19995_t:CDS:2, partial [Entrophospora sp. SA101]
NIVKEVDNLKFLKEIIPQTYSLEAALQKSEKIRRNLSRHNAKLNSEDASGDSNNSDEESDKSDDTKHHKVHLFNNDIPTLCFQFRINHFKKQLGIFHRPIPFEETIVKLEPKLIDSYAKDLVVKYLNNLISKFPEPIKITIHLPSTNTQHPIKLYPPNNNDSAAIHKEIILKLHDYSFFTDILINQNLFRALIIGYFKKSWDCNDLSLLFQFFFNFSNNKFNCINTTISDNKYQNWVNLIRDWYWKRIFTSDWYG